MTASISPPKSCEIEIYPEKGLTAGIVYEHEKKNSFLFSTGILYNQRGYNYDIKWFANNGSYIIFYDSNGKLIGNKYLCQYHYSYLSIPVKAGFRFGKRLRTGIQAGLLPSIIAEARRSSFDGYWSDITGTGQIAPEGWNRTSCRTLNLAAIASIDADSKLKEKVWLTMGFSYQHDITRMNWSYEKPIRLYGVTLNLGMKFLLEKRK